MMRINLSLFVIAFSLVGCSDRTSPSAEKTAVDSPVKVSAPAAPKVDIGPWDGPFGLKMGITQDQLKASMPDLTNKLPFLYETTSPPKPHYSFESYNFISVPSTGLCKISAIGRNIQTSAFGDELRNGHQSIKTALTEKYGNPTEEFNFLKHGSMWDEPKYWMMGLLKNDRVMVASWAKKSAQTPNGADLPNDIEGILLEVNAENTETGYVTLRYEFVNSSACLEEANRNKNQPL